MKRMTPSDWESFIVGVSAPITFTIIMGGGIPACYTYFLNKSTGKTSALSFITGFLLCNVWLVSGIFAENWYLVAVSAFGVLMQGSYIIIFLHYAKQKTIPFLQLLISFIPLVAVYVIYWCLDEDAGERETKVSIIWVFCMIAFVGAPWTQLRVVWETKCTENLPFMTIFFSFITSAQFFALGYVTRNFYFLLVPSAIALLLSMVPLMMFLVYPPVNVFQEDPPNSGRMRLRDDIHQILK